MTTRARLALLLLALAALACHQVILTAPPDSEIILVANPPFIVAHGGVSVISALVIEPAGTPVPDGTVVQFFTTLGRIDEQGKTNDGVARVNLVSDARSGVAKVRAVSGLARSDEIDIAIGSVLPKRLFLAADPSRITISRSTHIIANVFDDNGNPVANVPVFFAVVDNPSTEFMDSQGRPIFTDNNGRAEDVMRTRRTSSGTARVRATVAAQGVFLEATVDVPIVF